MATSRKKYLSSKHKALKYMTKKLVCRLKKALYGLKQASRAWCAHIDSFLMKLGFTRSNVDLNLYFKTVQGMPLILVIYFDDLFLTGSEPLILQYKRELALEFEIKYLHIMHYFWILKYDRNLVRFPLLKENMLSSCLKDLV